MNEMLQIRLPEFFLSLHKLNKNIFMSFVNLVLPKKCYLNCPSLTLCADLKAAQDACTHYSFITSNKFL